MSPLEKAHAKEQAALRALEEAQLDARAARDREVEALREWSLALSEYTALLRASHAGAGA